MKKKLFLSMIALVLPCMMLAQLKVNTNGNVSIALSSPVTAANLSTSYNSGYNYNTNYSFGIHTDKRSSKTFNIGISGRAVGQGTYSRSFGVQGVVAGGYSGYLYGVLGSLSNNTANGAGVFGTILHDTGVLVNGRYAGYFDGDTYIDGTLTATTVVVPSDMRLKENIVSVSSETEAGSTLNNLIGLNVIKYNDKELMRIDTDTTTVAYTTKSENLESHYGLMAQELLEIYPDLVKEGQDGYLSIKYLEFVPLLIRSIQELKAELDAVKRSINTELSGNSAVSNTASARSQYIGIVDAQGRMIKKRK